MKKELVIISAIWCPSCLIMNKYIKAIQRDYPDFEVKKLDYDLDDEEVQAYKVGDILPVMILQNKEGDYIDRLVGERDYDEIVEFIAKND